MNDRFDMYEPPRRSHRHIKPPTFETHDPKPTLGLRLLDAAVIIAGLLAFLLILGWAQQKDLDDAMEYQKEVATRYAHMLATCMNGGAVLDRVTNTAHFCGKTIEVKL